MLPSPGKVSLVVIIPPEKRRADGAGFVLREKVFNVSCFGLEKAFMVLGFLWDGLGGRSGSGDPVGAQSGASSQLHAGLLINL
jgi:hypothetical protein